MQKGPIESVDLVVDPAQRCIALRILVAPQQAAGEKRDQRQGNHQRGDHRRDNGDKKGPGIGTGPTREKQQRDEGKDQHECRTDHRRPDLERGIDRSLGSRLAHAQMPRDIFRDHDTVVDQQAERDDESGYRKLAHVEAGGIEHQQPGRQGERNRDHHDRGRTQSQWQQREDNQHDRDRKIAGQFVQPPLHVPALVKLHHQLDIRREDRPLPLQFDIQLFFEPGDIDPVLLRHGQEHGPLAVVPGAVDLLLCSPFDLCDVADGQQRSVGCPQRQAPDRVQFPIGTARLDVQPPLAALHGAAGQFGASLPHGIGDRARGHAQFGQFLGIGFDAHFRLRQSENPGFPHPGIAHEDVRHIIRIFFHPPPGSGFTDQRHLHDGGFRGPDLAIVQPLQSLGQPVAYRGYRAHHVVIIAVHVAGPFAELDMDDRAAVGACRLHLDDIVKALNDFFDRLGDRLFHFLRVGTRLDGDDIDRGDREMRIHRLGNIDERGYAQHHQQGEKHEAELPAGYYEPGKHVSADDPLAWPRRSLCNPDRLYHITIPQLFNSASDDQFSPR